jgi:copper transport outer membrane protein MctB
VISFRYHVVTVVAVFLALAVGIVLGGGPLRGEVDNTLAGQGSGDRAVTADLRSQITGLRSSSSFGDDFANTVAPGLIGNSLRGRVVTLVVLPTASRDDVAGLKRMVGVAGGSVGGTLQAGKQLVDASDKQLVDELGNQLQGRAKGVTVPADATPYERLGALIARAVGTKTRGGSNVDGTAAGILSGLGSASLLSAEGRFNRRGDLVLFVTGAGEGGSSQREGAGSIVATLVRTVDAGTSGVVLAGPVSAARAGGQVRAVRDDVATAKAVSTVDSVDRTAGQVVTMMALAGQAAGRSGQYGAVDAADGAMPGAIPTHG